MQTSDIRQLLIAEIDAVYRMAQHLSARDEEVDDLVQETYFRAFKSIDKFKLADYGPRPWLLRILHNLYCSQYDTKKRDRVFLETLSHDSGGTEKDSIDRLVDLSLVKWDQIDGKLKQALDALSPVSRTTFLLSAIEGLKYREIAAITEAPEGTVMSRLFRARADIAAHLGEYAREQGWTKSAPLRPHRADLHKEIDGNDPSVPLVPIRSKK